MNMREIPSYGKIFYLGHKAISHRNNNIFDGEVSIQEKIDGCFSGQTLVHLSDGTKKPIADLVKEKYNGYVRAFSIERGEYIDTKVVNWFKFPSNHKNMVCVKMYGRNQASKPSITCTEDHLFYTEDGKWVEASKLRPEKDKIQIISETLSFIQEQMIIGTLLGDAYMSPNKNGNSRYVCSHSKKCEEYNNLIIKLLGSFYARTDERLGGYKNSGLIQRIHSKSHYLFNEIYHHFYKNKKQIDFDWLKEKLSPISLAFWYMDDGSCNFSEKQRPRPIFNTQCFTFKDCNKLASILEEKFSIKSSVNETNKGPTLQISASSADIFFSLIGPYIHISMQYKLPFKNQYNDFFEKIDNFDSLQKNKEFVKIKSINKCKNQIQYDIETEEHNYLVSSLGVLVHNSQISLIKIDNELFFRSKNTNINPSDPGMFREAVESLTAIKNKIMPNMIYRGEYLQKPKHHTLEYSRIPKNHVIIFDIQVFEMGAVNYLSRKEVEAICEGVFEIVPEIKTGISSFDDIKNLLKTESYLGGCQIEGVVVKNYSRFNIVDGHIMKGKFVSDDFKEKKVIEWGASNPSKGDILQRIIHENATEARWKKSIQHAEEDNLLEGSPRDIGLLMKKIKDDIEEEEAENIKNQLYNYFKADILRGIVKNFPNFYKEELAKRNFD